MLYLGSIGLLHYFVRLPSYFHSFASLFHLRSLVRSYVYSSARSLLFFCMPQSRYFPRSFPCALILAERAWALRFIRARSPAFPIDRSNGTLPHPRFLSIVLGIEHFPPARVHATTHFFHRHLFFLRLIFLLLLLLLFLLLVPVSLSPVEPLSSSLLPCPVSLRAIVAPSFRALIATSFILPPRLRRYSFSFFPSVGALVCVPVLSSLCSLTLSRLYFILLRRSSSLVPSFPFRASSPCLFSTVFHSIFPFLYLSLPFSVSLLILAPLFRTRASHSVSPSCPFPLRSQSFPFTCLLLRILYCRSLSFFDVSAPLPTLPFSVLFSVC